MGTKTPLTIMLTLLWLELHKMTSSNGNIIRVTGPLCGEFTGHRSPHKGQWRRALMFCLICAWIHSWVNNRKTGDLRRHRAHCDVTVMIRQHVYSTTQHMLFWSWSVFDQTMEGVSYSTTMMPAYLSSPSSDRSGNGHRSLWVGRCVSSWWVLVWSEYH